MNNSSQAEKDILDKLNLSKEDRENPEIMAMISTGLVTYNIKKQV